MPIPTTTLTLQSRPREESRAMKETDTTTQIPIMSLCVRGRCTVTAEPGPGWPPDGRGYKRRWPT